MSSNDFPSWTDHVGYAGEDMHDHRGLLAKTLTWIHLTLPCLIAGPPPIELVGMAILQQPPMWTVAFPIAQPVNGLPFQCMKELITEGKANYPTMSMQSSLVQLTVLLFATITHSKLSTEIGTWSWRWLQPLVSHNRIPMTWEEHHLVAGNLEMSTGIKSRCWWWTVLDQQLVVS